MKTLSITIDGHVLEVEEGKSILHAALEADLYIPHLCHHPDLPDIGECRLCVVEIEGDSEIRTSCTTKAIDGMVVRTKTDRLNAMRRLSMELMLANHVDDCTTCPKYLKCELQSLIQYLEVSTSRLRRTLNSVPVNTANPLFVRDLNRCVSCGRCIRVCREVRGVDVLDFQMTEEDRIVVDVRNHHSMAEENCRFCGACVEVCPTGALQDKEGVFKPNLNRELELIPCKSECPAHTDVPKYIRAIKDGRYQDAIAVIREKAPFPHSLGYVCMAFCESVCRRKEINEALSIRELKKFAAVQDQGLWRDKARFKPKSGKKVAVVGGGPAGLTAAYYLTKAGHDVTVFEAAPVAGGMLSTGIPEYRLPREAVQAEIAEIERAGVRILTNARVTSLTELKNQGFHKMLIAIGAGAGTRLPIKGADLPNVYENIDFLRKVSLRDSIKRGKSMSQGDSASLEASVSPGESITLGDRVVVLGGGNVAFDCARSAVRLGAKEVRVVCLENREAMTASEDEIREGLEEGIRLINGRTFLAIEETNGRAAGVTCREVASFRFDENRRLQMELKPHSEHVIPADTVIFAAGQRPEVPEEWQLAVGRGNLILTEDGVRVIVKETEGKTVQTGAGEENSVKAKDLYAAGDAVYGTHSVIRAIAAGRKAASEIDLDLGGNGDIEEKLIEEATPSPYLGKDEEFLRLEREQATEEPAEARISNFNEVSHCFPDANACSEASRCLQCDLRTQTTRPKLWVHYKIK